MSAASSPLLDIRQLSVCFAERTTPALQDVSFALKPGEILGIVGETGAGKSVLARAIIGILPATARISAGEILVAGQNIAAMTPAQKRALRGSSIALIGTNAKSLLDPVTPVGKQIVRVLRVHHRIGKAQAWRTLIQLFRQVGIVDPQTRAHAYPHELSGGLAQRVVIAMALITQPKVLLADDATLGLDATIQLQVLDLMVQKAQERGLGVVLITHDLGIVARYCDRIGIMQQGRLIELASISAFFHREPRQAYSRELLDAARVRPTPVNAADDAAAVSPTTPPLLEVLDLVKIFRTSGSRSVVRAVDGVSLSIRPGETLALVGESGSGKTTIGQCVMKLLATDSGTIRFAGQNIVPMSDSEFRPLRQRIQMVFQEPYVALNPRWRVFDLVAEPLKLQGLMRRSERTTRVLELLDLVGIARTRTYAYPHELTAGEQKRIGIARALSVYPEFVIFDEPTTALDIRVRAQIIALIRGLQAHMGLSALFITHDLNSVRSLAHAVAVMQNGKLVEYGTTEKIFAKPEEDYTKKLLDAELPIE